MSTTVDLRCPVDSRRMFGRVLAEGQVTAENLVEFACLDCKKAKRRLGEDVRLVLHRFNMLGECVATETVP